MFGFARIVTDLKSKNILMTKNKGSLPYSKTVLFFEGDRWCPLLVTSLRKYKNSFTCYVENGAYYFKWTPEFVLAAPWKFGEKDSIKPDWDGYVTKEENVPYPTFIEISFKGGHYQYYNDIIIEARKKYLDPENYVPLKYEQEERLTTSKWGDMIPF